MVHFKYLNKCLTSSQCKSQGLDKNWCNLLTLNAMSRHMGVQYWNVPTMLMY